MTIYSLYIFDRHCACIYYQDWHRTNKPKQPSVTVDGRSQLLPGVSRAIVAVAPPPPPGSSATTRPTSLLQDAHAQSQSQYSQSTYNLAGNTGVVIAQNEPHQTPTASMASGQNSTTSTTALPFDEEAKLVYGVVLSLRNMIKKLSGRDENFVSYKTSTYRMHLFETLSVYAGPFDGDGLREHGIDNEHFRNAVDRLMRNLSVV
ncbi:uncharacterized protein EI90DRAFT_3070000 [Cantharellus anzutake]|uniref:uncharacterized protein n=1 Tax=Cantharellus anzutake TaxID=1750568 RepID=UPI001903E766|nr:uncharacterized protein EI90DRAFT_3070000 [Cantharellus anzutake]KAF8326632.1 hypothetical protein EI90DRAFT_3070000 [Cantharellus anzutake]